MVANGGCSVTFCGPSQYVGLILLGSDIRILAVIFAPYAVRLNLDDNVEITGKARTGSRNRFGAQSGDMAVDRPGS